MSDIVYTYGGGVYLNLTNKCPCNCTFCIRANGDGLGSARSLWLRGDPTPEEVQAALQAFDFSPFEEVVICGYGEPTSALENLRTASEYLRAHYPIKLRLNTNGLSDLINGRETAAEVCGLVDSLSISLNAPTAEKYVAVTRPHFGPRAFQAMLDFTRACVREKPGQVTMTVVNVIPSADVEACRALAESLGAHFRLREYTAE